MGWGRIKGAYLEATMASILFTGGLAPSIGIRGGGEWIRPGKTRTELKEERETVGNLENEL